MSAKQSANENNKQTVEPSDKKEAEQTKENPSTKQATSPTKKTTSAIAIKKPAKNKFWLVTTALFVLVLAAFAATGLVGWYGYQELIQLEQQLAERPTKQALQAPLQNLAAISDIKERQLYLQKNIENQQVHLTDLQQSLAKTSEPKPRDWLLAEVEYLLRLANQRLQLEEDVDGALTLMTTAEQRLKQANVPGTLGVRSDLLEDIDELKALPRLDRVSMALSLQELADQALSLKVQHLSDAPSLNLETNTLTTTEQTWYQNLWQEVKSLIVIRKRELPLEALPFTADELELRHQLSALLLQASWAVLRGEQLLYETSMAGAQKRLDGFDANQPATKTFNTQLQALVAQKVEQKLPETETSLDSLQAFIADRYKLKLPVTTEDAPSSETINQEVQP